MLSVTPLPGARRLLTRIATAITALPADPYPHPDPERLAADVVDDLAPAAGRPRRRPARRRARAARPVRPDQRRPAPPHPSGLGHRRHRRLRRTHRQSPRPRRPEPTPTPTAGAAPAAAADAVDLERWLTQADRTMHVTVTLVLPDEAATPGRVQELLDDVDRCLRTGTRLSDLGYRRQLLGLVGHSTSNPAQAFRRSGAL